MEQKAIYTFAKWQIKEGQRDTVLSLMKVVTKETLSETGNLNYQVFQSNDNDHTLMLFEKYQDQEAITFHRNSDHFQQIVIKQIIPLLENREVVLASEINLFS